MELLVSVRCQEALFAVMAVVSVGLMVSCFHMIVKDVYVAMGYCRLFVFPTVFVSCVGVASNGVVVFGA